MADRDRIINDATELCEYLSDTSKIDAILAEKKEELDEASELYRLLISQDATNFGTPE